MLTLRTPLERYAFAVATILLTLVIRLIMAPLWESTAPFALFMLATVVVTWFAGTGPALLTGAAGAVARVYFDFPVEGALKITWEEGVRLALFAGFVYGTIVVLERAKEDRRRLEASLAAAERARAEAEQANRLKDEFLAIVSHELRTPLNAILGWVTLLQGGSLTAPRTAHAIDVIHRNAKAQAQLVGDLLDVARSITGGLHLDVQSVDLVAVALRAADTARLPADEHGIAFIVKVPPAPLVVQGDAERLLQVLANLLGNAVKFTPAGGTVTLEVRASDSSAEMSVTDTGAGIAAGFLPHVFDRFAQADTGSTRRHGGLGLGLAIARQIVELHGGTIQAASEGLGRGARFTLRLPATAVPAEVGGAPVGYGMARDSSSRVF